jgi:hypothetical protein
MTSTGGSLCILGLDPHKDCSLVSNRVIPASLVDVHRARRENRSVEKKENQLLLPALSWKRPFFMAFFLTLPPLFFRACYHY